jgi:bacterioferritin-associated ferredoxin
MIVCSCNLRSDTELKAEAAKGTPWADAVLKLPVSNVCGHCKNLCKPMYAEARKQAGFPPETKTRRRRRNNKCSGGATGSEI